MASLASLSRHLWRLLPAFGITLAGCSRSADSNDGLQAGEVPPPADALFTKLSSKTTGVRFENRLTETADLNGFTYRNYYNGGGVGIGDLNGDGLPEVVLGANQGGPRLYLNEGRFHFRDVTLTSFRVPP